MDENPSDPDAIVADARARHRAGDLDAAARLYDSVLARAPDHAEALQLKGILLAQTGDPAAGLELLSRAAELAPESGPIRANLAKLRLDLGEIDAAVADYEAAVDLDPGNADLLFNLGGALALAGRRDEAIARLEELTGLSATEQREAALLQQMQAASLQDAPASSAAAAWLRSSRVGPPVFGGPAHETDRDKAASSALRVHFSSSPDSVVSRPPPDDGSDAMAAAELEAVLMVMGALHRV